MVRSKQTERVTLLAPYKWDERVLNMIEETTKKINFLAYNPDMPVKKEAKDAPTVTVSVKYNKIVFGASVLRETGMEGKFIRLYFEASRKIIGWQLRDSVSQGEMKVWKLVKSYGTNKVWTASITKILSQMRGLKKETYTKVPVQKYREMSPISQHKGEIFYFVELKDEAKLELNGKEIEL